MKFREPRVAAGSTPGAWGLLIRKVSYAQIAISPRLSQARTRHFGATQFEATSSQERPGTLQAVDPALGATQFEDFWVL